MVVELDEPDADCAMVDTGFVGSLELMLSVCERSSVVGPESRCCCSVASAAESPGFWFENAQMMLLLELLVPTGMVKTSFGLLPVSTLSDESAVAFRGGLGSTVGITSDGALRWESVIDPFEFGHIMTIGVFAIVDPNPLSRTNVHEKICYPNENFPSYTHIAIQPRLADPRLWRVSVGCHGVSRQIGTVKWQGREGGWTYTLSWSRSRALRRTADPCTPRHPSCRRGLLRCPRTSCPSH